MDVLAFVQSLARTIRANDVNRLADVYIKRNAKEGLEFAVEDLEVGEGEGGHLYRRAIAWKEHAAMILDSS